jgi:phage baseplate assembly protein V
MIRYGLVSQFSPSTMKAKVKFGDDDIVTDWLPIIKQRTSGDQSFDCLVINEQVACIMDENLETGVILGAIYSTADTPPEEAGEKIWGRKFEDGTILKYDQSSHKLTVKLVGSGAKMEIEGDVEVTGKITASGNIETSTGDVKAGTVALKLHTHTGVTTGGGSSGPPAGA